MESGRIFSFADRWHGAAREDLVSSGTGAVMLVVGRITANGTATRQPAPCPPDPSVGPH